MHNFAKQRLSFFAHLQGMAAVDSDWFDIIKIARLVEKQKENEIRRDGSPGFSHELAGVNLALTLNLDQRSLKRVIAAYLMHDMHEDYAWSREYIVDLAGEEVWLDVWAMSKIQNGIKISDEQYSTNLIARQYGGILKGIDRFGNLSTMTCDDVDRISKQLIETEELILPIIKSSRQRFPEFWTTLELLKTILTTQVKIYRTATRR